MKKQVKIIETLNEDFERIYVLFGTEYNADFVDARIKELCYGTRVEERFEYEYIDADILTYFLGMPQVGFIPKDSYYQDGGECCIYTLEEIHNNVDGFMLWCECNGKECTDENEDALWKEFVDDWYCPLSKYVDENIEVEFVKKPFDYDAFEKEMIKEYGINPKEDNLIGFTENYWSNGRDYYIELYKHNDLYYIVTENYFDYTGDDIINGNTDSDSCEYLDPYCYHTVHGRHIYILDFCITSFLSTLLPKIFEDYLYDYQTEDEIDLYKYNPQELVNLYNDYFDGCDFIDNDYEKDNELKEIFDKENIKY